MHTTMDVGIIVTVIMFNGFNHRQRLLRRGGVVKIDQRLTVDLLVQNGKVLAHLLHVKCFYGMDPLRRLGDRAHPCSFQARSTSAGRSPANCAASGKNPTTRCSMCSRTGPGCMRSKHSLANASRSRWRAEDSSRP